MVFTFMRSFDGNFLMRAPEMIISVSFYCMSTEGF